MKRLRFLPTGSTVVCASIGKPNKHSLSPLMHNAAFKYMNLDFVYVAFEPQNAKDALEAMKALGIRGYSVTRPFKNAAVQYLDALEPDAENIGAVNTVVNNHGKLIGSNTDWRGAIEALKSKCTIEKRKVVVFGAGNTARAVVYGLRKEGASRIVVLNRTQERSRQLARNFDVESSPLSSVEKYTNFDIVINTTSVGEYPNTNESIVQCNGLFTQEQFVLDVVYRPLETRFLHQARSVDAETIPGYKMLVRQGAEQFRKFTGASSAPLEIMEKAVLRALR